MIRKTCGFVLLALGILVIVVGVVIEVVPDQMIKKNLALVPGSELYQAWTEPAKLPTTIQFSFFDLQNNFFTRANNESTDTPIEEGGMPVVEERGPYVYREKIIRSNFTFNEDKTQISFTERTEYEFDEEASNGKEVSP